MIELKNISRVYQLRHGSVQALDDINLTIQRGEILGIFGESGAGKSTLLRIINLLEQPDSGQVKVDGVELTGLSLPQLRQQRRNIGMIFQHFNLLQSRTVYGNITLPLELAGRPKDEIASEVASLLELTGLSGLKDHFPDQLSGGQKQRVAIARALATRPHILLCDEATSSLDPKSTTAILALLKEINSKLGVTIVLITHEMDVIKQICDRAAVLHRGRLVETGTVLEIFARPQTVITEQLVQKALHLELPAVIRKNLRQEAGADRSRLVRFTFVGDESSQPLITTLVRQFNITVNIIQANIEHIQDATVGFTVCQLSGNKDSVDQALAYIKPTSVTAEVLGYV